LQISGPEAQRYVHEMRKQEAAILVGYRTALLDDPQLTVRLVENPAQLQPRRLVLDPKAELAARAPSLKLFSPELQSVFLATSLPTQAEYAKHYQLLKPGVSQVQAVCAFAYEQRLLSLIVEGGVRTLAQFISADCWDEIHRFSAATCLGAGQAGILAPSLNIRSLSTPSLPASLGLPAPITPQAKYQLGADLLEIFVRAGQIPNLVTELAAYPEHLHSVLTQD
jgi:diaminohydroxyphosphoribosylaminopyrimidine deaminase/5-amino-6-(5-phosphoribosylamino)uracil reductase